MIFQLEMFLPLSPKITGTDPGLKTAATTSGARLPTSVGGAPDPTTVVAVQVVDAGQATPLVATEIQPYVSRAHWE